MFHHFHRSRKYVLKDIAFNFKSVECSKKFSDVFKLSNFHYWVAFLLFAKPCKSVKLEKLSNIPIFSQFGRYNIRQEKYKKRTKLCKVTWQEIMFYFLCWILHDFIRFLKVLRKCEIKISLMLSPRLSGLDLMVIKNRPTKI